MQVVVTSFGSAGDFNPLLAIAAALVRNGVGVTFVANPFYASRVEATGSRFVGAGEFFDIFAALEANPRYFNPRSGMAAIWKELVAPSIRDIYPVVVDTVRDVGATVVVSHMLSYGGAWAAATTGVRSVLASTSSAGWLSRHEPLVIGTWRAPRFLQGWATVALRAVGGVLLGRWLRPLAADLHAPFIPEIMRQADLNLGLWPEWFRAPASDDPPRSQICGFVFDAVEASHPLPMDLERFLSDGDAPVVAGFGSAASLHAPERYRAVARGCAELGRRCLLIGASANVVAETPTLKVVASAPYAKVFPRAAAVVHHGGMGTCAEALRAGKPSLVTPFAFDQFDTAERVEQAACGRWLRNPDALAAVLDDTLRNETLAASARRVARQIASVTDGAQRAAELISAVDSSPDRIATTAR